MKGVRYRNATLCSCIAILIYVPLMCATEASDYRVIYSFTYGADGGLPTAGMIADSSGNLYGTTSNGGTGCRGYCGAVFELGADGTLTVLHDFTGDDGANPEAPLIIDRNGNLFGTTFDGGNGGRYGPGTVFKLSPNGTETVLHKFAGNDGANPAAGLLLDEQGNLYGTAQGGGEYGSGVVFEVTSAGAYNVVYSFKAPSLMADGAMPVAGLVQDNSGNFYGTTLYGGRWNGGTVFKLASSGAETVIHSFGGDGDGYFPLSSLLFDHSGNIYGTTCSGGIGAGTVFELAPGGTETILYSFGGRTDGICPSANLIWDKEGNLYGTTAEGGQGEVGTVFQLTPSGTLNVLHTFQVSRDDGAQSFGGLVKLGRHLYGTTYVGGQNDGGTIFSLRK